MYELFSQRRPVRLIFKQLCHITISSWIKIFIHAVAITSLYGTDLIHETCIHFYISAPNKEINFFLSFFFFVALLLILSFHSLTLVPYKYKMLILI